MDSVNPVLPGEVRSLTGDASARASDETGMQLDPMQARLDELLRRLESQESLIRTLQATQVPLNEDTQEAAWRTTEAAEPQQQFDDAWWNGYDQWTGQDWSGLMRLGAIPSQRTIPRLCQRGMETRNSLMTMSLMSSCTKEARIQVIIASLFLD